MQFLNEASAVGTCLANVCLCASPLVLKMHDNGITMRIHRTSSIDRFSILRVDSKILNGESDRYSEKGAVFGLTCKPAMCAGSAQTNWHDSPAIVSNPAWRKQRMTSRLVCNQPEQEAQAWCVQGRTCAGAGSRGIRHSGGADCTCIDAGLVFETRPPSNLVHYNA